MRSLEIRATPEAEEYLYEIVEALLILFPIDREEALGRVEREWSGRKVVDPSEVMNLLHEEPDTWAKNIYFGRGSGWWLHSDLEPLPYP